MANEKRDDGELGLRRQTFIVDLPAPGFQFQAETLRSRRLALPTAHRDRSHRTNDSTRLIRMPVTIGA
jgi:hypothetical protein